MQIEWEDENAFFDLDQESIQEYRDFMNENFEIIKRNKSYFLRDRSFSTSFKLDRLEELLDFFIVEEDYDKCKELMSIKELLEIKLMINTNE
jgi:hypothetical protein